MAISMSLEDIVTRTLEDVQSLESQIRSLLKTMEAAENIDSVPELPLPEPPPQSVKESERGGDVSVRMEWSGPPERGKRARKGSNATITDQEISAGGVSVLSGVGGVIYPDMEMEDKGGMEELSALDVMELCIKENIMKYEVVEESVFFVPVLDRCVFGMTLRNVANSKLRKPSISLSLLPSNSSAQKLGRCFLYNTHVRVKDVDPSKIGRKMNIPFQDTFTGHIEEMGEEWVMAGCEVQVSATFPCPSHPVRDNNFSLLVSVFLDRQQLWNKKLHIDNRYFNAASIDLVFRSHHADILMALGCHHQTFKIERVLSQNGKTVKKSLEKFLLPMGYECILSQPNGIDSSVEFYASRQPSMYWGSYFKIENSSRKRTVMRCLVSTRTREQMHLLYDQFQVWLRNEVDRERKHGTGKGPQVTALCPKSNKTIVNKIESEMQLILRLQDVKSILSKERESGRSQKRTQDRNFCDIGTIDSNWIHEYCLCITNTDGIFVEKMEK